MHETHDALGPQPQGDDQSAKSLKTIDLGIDGLAPAVHLGAGGSANVFAAKQMDTGEAVAVKLLRASADSEKERVRFEREQETLKRLVTHDGIVPVLDAGLTDREEPYFLMPLMEGSLQDRIDRDGPLDWQTATQLIAQVADTVAFAHEHSVLHRDLKPGNILLDREGVPRVADFGIAKLLDSQHSKSSKSLGTPSFMPPERFNGLEATEESDVYGLGATLAALITGSAPFLTGENDTDAAVMMRVVTEAPPTLDNLDVPEEVRMAVQLSMAKDPADRPATAAEFAEQLRMAIDPHLDPALAGPVTVAIPRRNISIPDGPATKPDSSSANTIDLTPEEDEERRKFPIWLAAAVLAIIAMIGGVMGVNAITGDDTQTTASDVTSTGDQDEVTDESDDAQGSGDSASDDSSDGSGDGSDGNGSDGSSGSDSNNTADDTGELLGAGDDDDSDGTGVDGDDIDTQVGGTQETNDGATGTTGDGSGDGTNNGSSTGGDTSPTTTVTQSGSDDDDSTPEPEVTTTTTTTAKPAPKAPVACFSATKSKVETGDTVSFTNCSTDATSYSWDLAGSSSTSTNPSKSWATAGTKTVRLTATGAGGSHTRTLTITVSEQPPPPTKPDACFNAPSTAETGQTISLSNCSTDATSYSWNLAGASSSLTNPTMKWSTAGTKTITLTATGPGGTDSTSKTVKVTAPTPPADACFTASTTSIEEGQSVTFTNCSKNAKSYWWEFGDGGTSSHTSPTHTFNSHGTYTVKLTANGDGGNDTTTKTITVKEPDPVDPDERVRPTKIGCTTIAVDEWDWSWETLPSWVNDYQVQFSDGSKVSVGRQPPTYRTKKKVTHIIAIDKNNYALASSVPSCPPISVVPTPSGVSCKFSNFRMEDGRWTWSESWSWADGGSAVDKYLVQVETNGALGGQQSPNGGRRSHSTNPTNGVPNSGLSLKKIIAVGTDGTTAVRTISTCGSEGGTGWQSPPK